SARSSAGTVCVLIAVIRLPLFNLIRSPRQQNPSINAKATTGHIRSLVRYQKSHRRSNFLWFPQPAKRKLPPFFSDLLFREKAALSRSIGPAGFDDVDPDAIGRKFGCPGSRHMVHGSLRSVISCAVGKCPLC